MPKREPTPPPAEDEPKYLAIIYPYPSMANMAIREDYLSLARWLACVMGPEGKNDLYAIFWKPSAPNMVLIEVAYHEEEWPGWRTLLGAHKWSEFSLEHDPDQGEKLARIYYSTFRSGREVEKTGWGRIHIKDDWFVGWHPRNAKIAYPYPLSHWCELPAEDQTAHRICKPIPKKLFQGTDAGAARGRPVVGSDQWAGKKEQTPEPPAASTSSSRPINSTNNRFPRDPYEEEEDDESPQEKYVRPAPPEEDDSDREYRVIGAAKKKWLKHGAKFSSVAEDAMGPSPREDFKCPSHGPLCKKGICADWKQYVRDVERAKERAEMVQRAAEQRGRGGGPGRGRGGMGRGRGNPYANGQSPPSSNHSGSSTPRGRQGATSPPARGNAWRGRGGPPRSGAASSERGPSRAQSP